MYFLPHNISSFYSSVDNWFYFIANNESRRFYGGHIEVIVNQTDIQNYLGKTYYHYRGSGLGRIQLFGRSEFYPYDSYMINLTIRIPNFGFHNKTIFSIYPYFYDNQWFIDPQPPRISFEDYWTSINYKIYIRRQPWTYSYLNLIPSFAFLFLGGIYLISPEDLRNRLTIVVPLFIFVSTFNLQIPLPYRTGMTFYEFKVLLLFLAVSSIGFVSLIEYTLIKKFKKDGFLASYLLEFLLLFSISYYIYLVYAEYSSMSQKYYMWVILPSSFEIIFPFLFGSVIKLATEHQTIRKEIQKLLILVKIKKKTEKHK